METVKNRGRTIQNGRYIAVTLADMRTAIQRGIVCTLILGAGIGKPIRGRSSDTRRRAEREGHRL